MEKKEDLRVRRTKKLLAFSLLDLMEEKPYNKINVNEICDKAMIHRATFYTHFYDKNDLFDYILSSLSEELFEKAIKKANFVSYKEMYLTLISCVIDFILENKNKLIKIIKNENEKLINVVIETLKRSITYYESKSNIKEKHTIPKDIVMNFYIGGFATLGFNLLNDNINCNKEDLMKYCESLFNQELFK